MTVIDDLPRDLYASPSPAAPGPPLGTVRIFFVRGQVLEPVLRLATGPEDPSRVAMTDLLTGPTPEEAQRGLSTAIPAGAQLLGVELRGSVATADLSKEFELGAEQEVLVQRLAQVVYTLTDLPRISRVRFLIDGEPVSVVAEDGELQNRPVGRNYYPSLAPGERQAANAGAR
ncbi:MAG: GerMN domain-containing protein [Actinomycetota bacterium]|nr:GerMN domain-containing protein [Actinomycetota bacterium]